MVENSSEVDQGAILKGLIAKDEGALVQLLHLFGPRLKGWLRSRFGDLLQRAELDEALSVTAYNVWRFAGRLTLPRGRSKPGSSGLRETPHEASSAASSFIERNIMSTTKPTTRRGSTKGTRHTSNAKTPVFRLSSLAILSQQSPNFRDCKKR